QDQDSTQQHVKAASLTLFLILMSCSLLPLVSYNPTRRQRDGLRRRDTSSRGGLNQRRHHTAAGRNHVRREPDLRYISCLSVYRLSDGESRMISSTTRFQIVSTLGSI
ncbi:hypothetical protein ILYODFUR_008377, partial [Ilyodon furcidens]